nr:putative clathrin assembly protein At4g40080 [Ipomoea batatas]
MGRITNLRDLIGVVKDKASQSKLALVSKPNTLSLRLAVLRVTAHSPNAPPDDRYLSSLLSLGDSSRAIASTLICALMDRLHRTGDSTVALKCLLTIHHVIKRGPFILQDQLSIFPAAGGRNYLKLSAFRDGATAATWILSAWVRFYARYLETLLFASRVSGYFLCSSSCAAAKDKQIEKLTSLMNSDLIGDVNSLIGLMEEMCKAPDSLLLEGNKLLYEVVGLLSNDYLSLTNELLPRLGELKERLGRLSFADSVELACDLKRLEDCKERLSGLFTVAKPSVQNLWSLVQNLRERIEMLKVCREGRLLTFGTPESKSARFDDHRVSKFCNSVRFSSGKYDEINKFALVVVEP